MKKLVIIPTYNEKENIVNNFSFEEFLGKEFDKNEKDFKD